MLFIYVQQARALYMAMTQGRGTVIFMPMLRKNYAYIKGEDIQNTNCSSDTANTPEGQPGDVLSHQVGVLH